MARIMLKGSGDGNQHYSRNINGNTTTHVKTYIGTGPNRNKQLGQFSLIRTVIDKHTELFEAKYDHYILESVYFNTKTKEYYDHKCGPGCPKLNRRELVSPSKPRISKKVHVADEGSTAEWDFLS